MTRPVLESPFHNSSLIAALRFSQQAPVILSHGAGTETLSVSSLLSLQGGSEHYGTLEQLFFTCLQSGDNVSALQCLEKLILRFGSSNERIAGLQGLYEEATAETEADLEKCLDKYNTLLSENPVNLPILKRRVALLRSMSKPADAIGSLVELLQAFPTDAEAWCELADQYLSQGMSSQAVFSLEEALLIAPNAWNIHARLGEILYLRACSSDAENPTQYLTESIRSFCRSIELCDDYVRGYYGLILATSQNPSQNTEGVEHFIPLKTAKKLNAFARGRMGVIVKERLRNHEVWELCQGELIAAEELLSRVSGLG